MRWANIFNLGIKELRSLARDPMMLFLVAYSFTIAVYTAATAMPETLNRAPIAIVDEDRSPLSTRIVGAFYPPSFLAPELITPAEMDARMDAGLDTFALDIPPNFQRDVLAGRQPTIQLNVDATRMSQAFTGSGYIQQIVSGEVNAFAQGYRAVPVLPVDLALRARFNPELNKGWFGAVIQVINQVTMLSIILTGAALIREREHGTIEHLLVMPVTPFEIMTGKIWSMALVVLVACAFSLAFVVQGLLSVPIEGSIALFLAGAALHLFATTSMGIFMGTVVRSMPQFGMLLILVLIPMQMLSGGDDAAREYAGAGSGCDARGADDALHHAGAGDLVSRSGPVRGLASVSRIGRYRYNPIQPLVGAIPKEHQRNGLGRGHCKRCPQATPLEAGSAE